MALSNIARVRHKIENTVTSEQPAPHPSIGSFQRPLVRNRAYAITRRADGGALRCCQAWRCLRCQQIAPGMAAQAQSLGAHLVGQPGVAVDLKVVALVVNDGGALCRVPVVAHQAVFEFHRQRVGISSAAGCSSSGKARQGKRVSSDRKKANELCLTGIAIAAASVCCQCNTSKPLQS